MVNRGHIRHVCDPPMSWVMSSYHVRTQTTLVRHRTLLSDNTAAIPRQPYFPSTRVDLGRGSLVLRRAGDADECRTVGYVPLLHPGTLGTAPRRQGIARAFIARWTRRQRKEPRCHLGQVRRASEPSRKACWSPSSTSSDLGARASASSGKLSTPLSGPECATRLRRRHGLVGPADGKKVRICKNFR